MPREALKLFITVEAGLWPGMVIEKYSRRWSWATDDQAAYDRGDAEALAKYIRISGESREYAASLENLRVVNWVRRDWVWL